MFFLKSHHIYFTFISLRFCATLLGLLLATICPTAVAVTVEEDTPGLLNKVTVLTRNKLRATFGRPIIVSGPTDVTDLVTNWAEDLFKDQQI